MEAHVDKGTDKPETVKGVTVLTSSKRVRTSTGNIGLYRNVGTNDGGNDEALDAQAVDNVHIVWTLSRKTE